MKNFKLNLLVFVTLLGLGISIYLTIHHFEFLTKGLQKIPLCSFNEAFDCDSVLISRFAKLGPFPLGGLGLVYYFYLFLSAVAARVAKDLIPSLLVLPFLSLLPGLGFILYLLFVSAFVLKTWCLFCLSIYLITFVSFFLLRAILNIPFSQIGSFSLNYLRALCGKTKLAFEPHFFGNALFLFLTLGLGLFMLYTHENKYAADLEDFDPKAFLDFHYIQPQVSFDSPQTPFWGKANAPVKIVEFSDFECPFCKRAADILKPYLKQHLRNIQFFFVNHPLDKSCNPDMKRELHQRACAAAGAAICADKEGKFWEYHDLLFAHQPKFSEEQLKHYAENLRLNVQKFSECLIAEDTNNRLRRDLELGHQAMVNGTPTVFVNGRRVKEWINPIKLNLVIEEELRRSR